MADFAAFSNSADGRKSVIVQFASKQTADCVLTQIGPAVRLNLLHHREHTLAVGIAVRQAEQWHHDTTQITKAEAADARLEARHGSGEAVDPVHPGGMKGGSSADGLSWSSRNSSQHRFARWQTQSMSKMAGCTSRTREGTESCGSPSSHCNCRSRNQ